jgi:hypothetical protein
MLMAFTYDNKSIVIENVTIQLFRGTILLTSCHTSTLKNIQHDVLICDMYVKKARRQKKDNYYNLLTNG